MQDNDSNTPKDSNQVGWLIKIYNQAIKNFPLLKYSKVLLVSIILLALIAFFKLKNGDVFFYAFGILLLSFLGFVISYFMRDKSRFTRFAFQVLISAIVITIMVIVLSFAFFIVKGEPVFYERWFPPTGSVNNRDTTNVKSDDDKITQETDSVKEKNNDPSRDKINKESKTVTGSHDEVVVKTSVTKEDSAVIRVGKTRVAILPFENVSDNPEFNWLSKGISETALMSFPGIDEYVLVEGNLRSKVLKEIDFQQGRYVDPASAAKIGKLMGAEKVVIGSFQIHEGKLNIIGRVVSVQSGQIDPNSMVENDGDIKNLFQVQKGFANKLGLYFKNK